MLVTLPHWQSMSTLCVVTTCSPLSPYAGVSSLPFRQVTPWVLEVFGFTVLVLRHVPYFVWSKNLN